MTPPAYLIVDAKAAIQLFLFSLPAPVSKRFLEEVVKQIFDVFFSNDQQDHLLTIKIELPSFENLPDIDETKITQQERLVLKEAVYDLAIALNKMLLDVNAMIIHDCHYYFHSFSGHDIVLRYYDD